MLTLAAGLLKAVAARLEQPGPVPVAKKPQPSAINT
jgi:hypothetical protein